MKDMTLRVPRTRWTVECRDKHGRLKWTQDFHNAVTDQGINDLLTQYFKGAGYTANWYIGLIATGATLAATDTMASHAGWTENAAYSGVSRPAVSFGPVGTKTLSNTANKALFTMTGAAVLHGMFLTNASAKSGTTGTLYATAAFSGGDQTLSLDDVLAVAVTVVGAQ